jgi:hypothetical protein
MQSISMAEAMASLLDNCTHLLPDWRAPVVTFQDDIDLLWLAHYCRGIVAIWNVDLAKALRSLRGTCFAWCKSDWR